MISCWSQKKGAMHTRGSADTWLSWNEHCFRIDNSRLLMLPLLLLLFFSSSFALCYWIGCALVFHPLIPSTSAILNRIIGRHIKSKPIQPSIAHIIRHSNDHIFSEWNSFSSKPKSIEKFSNQWQTEKEEKKKNLN